MVQLLCHSRLVPARQLLPHVCSLNSGAGASAALPMYQPHTVIGPGCANLTSAIVKQLLTWVPAPAAWGGRMVQFAAWAASSDQGWMQCRQPSTVDRKIC